jgi:hypothetical protein
MSANGLHVPGRYGKPTNVNRGGMLQRFAEKLLAMGHDAARRTSTGTSGLDAAGYHIHPDYLRVAIYEFLEGVGCRYRVHSPVMDVVKKGKRVLGVVVTDRNGHSTFRANTIIDATGDGDIAFLAGAQFESGRKSDGMCMPVTLTFTLGNVDYPRLKLFKPGQHKAPSDTTKMSLAELDAQYRKNPATATEDDDVFYTIIAEARSQGYCTAMWYAVTPTTLPGVVSVNNGGPYDIGNLDGTKVQHLTIAERYGAKIATDFVEIASRWKIPGLERCFLYSVGAEVALRETRRIIGDYYLTDQDAVEGPPFEDVVAVEYCKGSDTVHYHSVGKRIKSIPYRCLLPKGLEGILMAGRCVSASQAGALAGFAAWARAWRWARLRVWPPPWPPRRSARRGKWMSRACRNVCGRSRVRLFPQDLAGIEGV